MTTGFGSFSPKNDEPKIRGSRSKSYAQFEKKLGIWCLGVSFWTTSMAGESTMSLRNMFECRYGSGMIMKNEVTKSFVLECSEEAECKFQEHGPSRKLKGTWTEQWKTMDGF